MKNSDNDRFAPIPFKGTLRPSQQKVVEIARRKLKDGKKRLHIVAPPGSGKTVLGLCVWAQLICKPCVVLSPNSAIQSQWAARTDLFELPGPRTDWVSTNPSIPNWLTSLTYQSVTMPARNIAAIEDQAVLSWEQKLIDEEQVQSAGEAKLWIEDLRSNNPDYFQRQLSNFEKRIRDELAKGGDSISLLHDSSKENLDRLAERNIGLIILDECHHLLGHWGRVLSDALPVLGDPIVIGLTATPPDRDGKDERDVQRYDRFFGGIDFEVPVPAVVKDGFLAPYQDLAYFVRPTKEELKFIATADQRLHELVEKVCSPKYLQEMDAPEPDSTEAIIKEVNQDHGQEITTNGTPDASVNEIAQPKEDGVVIGNITDWLDSTLTNYRLPTGEAKDWSSFARRDQSFSLAARQFLSSRELSLPSNVPHLGPDELTAGMPAMEYLVPVLDRFVRHFLRRSAEKHHHSLATQLTSSLRTLGVQITDTGTRPCVSPVGRVLAYSKSKTNALIPILVSEIDSLDESIRAVVIADFERSSAVTAQLKSLMDDETGGAIAAFKALISDERTDALEPILLTGSTILIDDEIEVEFLKQANAWLANRNLKVELESIPVSEFRQIIGKGSDWAPRVYVEMVTELFQDGLTRCLVGTRGLLGEGWDANKINVLVDLTTVTTNMSINQLRGRSFRLDPEWSEKLANNWDVVCIAPEFSKGFDDYQRFKSKHANLYGVTDDGVIEKGVGHVHPALTEVKPEGLESSVSLFNDEMIERGKRRGVVRELWKIGQPFESKSIDAVEVRFAGGGAGFPTSQGKKEVWSDQSLTSAIANAVLASLAELGLVRSRLKPNAGSLSGGYVRVFLTDANPEESELFAGSMKQILGPLDRPRYVVPRNVIRRHDTWLSRFLPSVVKKYFQTKKKELAMLHAVPAALARNKSNVMVFQKHWNHWVSSGEAIYAHRGEGEELVQKSKLSQSAPIVHQKQLFV